MMDLALTWKHVFGFLIFAAFGLFVYYLLLRLGAVAIFKSYFEQKGDYYETQDNGKTERETGKE